MNLPHVRWQLPPTGMRLGRGEVHVWRLDLNQAESLLAPLRAVLSPDEWARADQFCFVRDSQRFVAARGLVRLILADYLDCDPARLRFSYGPRGKPALEGGRGLRFNLSHSDHLALLAVSREREVGIDVEQFRTDLWFEEIMARFFAPAEVEALQALPIPSRQRAFFQIWTCKEAYVKALGVGLGMPTDQFDVSTCLTAPAVPVHDRWEPPELARWSVRPLRAGPGYAAAVAAEGAAWQVRYWQWQPAGLALPACGA